MKTAEAKTASTALQRKADNPFFAKDNKSFFADQVNTQSKFFNRDKDSTRTPAGPGIQKKLTVGSPHDVYEKEADNMADKVVQRLAIGGNAPSIQKCDCEKEQGHEKEEKDQQKEVHEVKRKAIFESDNESQVQKKSGKTDSPVVSVITTPIPVFTQNASTAGRTATGVQAKCNACEQEEKQQKKDDEGEEPVKLMRKPIFESEARDASLSQLALVQRKCSACEQEEKQSIVRKAIPNATAPGVVQRKCSACEQEEKQSIKRKAYSYTSNISGIVQRSCRECDEGDKVLTKSIAGVQLDAHDRTPDADGSRTSIVAAAQGEVGKVKARLNDGTGGRVGGDRLMEYFHLAAPGVWDDSMIQNVNAKMPSWCGIFSVWAHKKAGKDLGNWEMGKGVSRFGTLTATDSPQPGDIGYIDQPNQHHAVVKEMAGDTVHTIDGNSGLNSEVIENEKPRSAYSGFLTAFGGGSSSGNVQSKGESAASNNGESVASESVESRINSTKGKGSSLPADTRQNMEQSFGSDFGNVRIHTDSNAAQLNKDLQAHAFTHGSDIYFNSGKYDSGSASGQRLLAHELTHVVQQGQAPEQVQRYSWDEFVDDVGDVADSAVEVVEDGAEAIAETAEDVGEAIVETGEKAIEVVTDVASSALDWLKTTAGEALKGLVEFLGGTISITSAGLEVTFPKICPIGMIPIKHKFDEMKKEKLWYVAALPVGPDLFLTGQVGIKGAIRPEIQLQFGPICLEGMHMLVNPITNNYSISGSISATTGVALGAELRGGLKAQLGLTALLPTPIGPIPITAPLVGVEGGLAGLVRGMAIQRVTLGNGLIYSGGTITASGSHQTEYGLAADLFAGLYAQLDIEGKNVCRVYWEPLEWHGSIAAALGLSGDVSITPGSPTVITPTINKPTLGEIPFDSLPNILNRKGLSDDCPIKEKICEVLKALGLLPSQNGGKWDWAGTGHGGVYGPGAVLPGPQVVYQRNPGIASSALCRGACGSNCDTCTHHPVYMYTDPVTHETWQYTNYEECKSNDGCREHDAAFDWAADAHGETGKWAIIMPYHMLANMECTCNNVTGNCIAWIAGLPPYDSDLNFADSATRVSSGGGLVPGPGPAHSSEPIGEWTDDYYHYSVAPPSGNFSAGVERWTNYHTNCQAEAQAATGVPDALRYITFLDGTVGDTYIDRNSFTTRYFTSIIHGILVPAFHYRNHTEVPAGSYVTTTLDLFTPDCRSGGAGPSSAGEEEELEKCDRGELPPDYCEELHNRVIERFGNRERDINLNPDTDVNERKVREDDAPIMSEFRKSYNRMESWDLYMKNRHPDLYPEFDHEFQIPDTKLKWMEELKEKTKEFKRRFRDARTQDVEALRKKFTEETLTEMRQRIDERILKMAIWYKDKTGNTEDINALIERVHVEGTELWRAAWRATILAVNRILSRLWPAAKARIIGWVIDQRNLHPGVDLSGDIGELDYVGSLATGYKGAPKQFARFNPDKFDVDGKLVAPPLEKFAVNIRGILPDRERIFAIGQNTTITPLIDFCNATQRELVSVDGYDPDEQFDVVIEATNTAGQQKSVDSTARIYALRKKLGAVRYQEMVTELRTSGLLVEKENSWQLKSPMSFQDQTHFNAIMKRYE